MSPRLSGLAHIARQQPYEGALAFALGIAAVWSLTGNAGSGGAVSRVLTHGEVIAADVMLVAGGGLTLGGLFGVGVAVSGVRRVLARRVEQAGQVLMSGVLAATALGAFSVGAAGVVGGLVYASLAAAGAVRSAQVGRSVRGSGVERTELVG